MELVPELLQLSQTVGLLTCQEARDQAYGFTTGSITGRHQAGQQACRHCGIIERTKHILQIGQMPNKAPGRFRMPNSKEFRAVAELFGCNPHSMASGSIEFVQPFAQAYQLATAATQGSL